MAHKMYGQVDRHRSSRSAAGTRNSRSKALSQNPMQEPQGMQTASGEMLLVMP